MFSPNHSKDLMVILAWVGSTCAYLSLFIQKKEIPPQCGSACLTKAGAEALQGIASATQKWENSRFSVVVCTVADIIFVTLETSPGWAEVRNK